MGEAAPAHATRGRRGRQLLAWSVHLYTALGLVAAAAMAVLIVRGEAVSFHWAFVLMLVATLIDSTDGPLARLVRVKEVLPGFDGRRLDDLTDFLTYTCLPLLLIWRAELLPAGKEWCLLVPLLASAYGFSQVSAKTDDGYFLGFPSYWNLVAFYLYVLRLPGPAALAVLLGLALLTFVPIRYLNPNQRGAINRLTWLPAALWAGMLVWILIRLLAAGDSARLDPATWILALVSLYFPVYYFGVSWGMNAKRWRRPHGGSANRR
jgi:phosphatidylcholine synthase